MISQFDWGGCTAISDKEKRSVEDEIRRAFEDRGDIELKTCHDGPVKVQLSIDGPLLSYLVGNIECSCGKKYFTFRGASDASNMKFEQVI